MGLPTSWRKRPKLYGPNGGEHKGVRDSAAQISCGGLPLEVGGDSGGAAAASSSAVGVWLVAAPGLLEAEIEIGRLRG